MHLQESGEMYLESILRLSKEKALVEVPYLEGSIYDESLASQYPDFTIKLQQQYDDTKPKGEILHTEPTGGSKVVKGSELWSRPPVRK